MRRQILAAGGDFTSMSGLPMTYLATINAATGSVLEY